MVNWREDVEFCFVLFMLISNIIIFFSLYEWTGIPFAGGVVGAVFVVEALIAFAAFETDWAIARWELIGKTKREK